MESVKLVNKSARAIYMDGKVLVPCEGNEKKFAQEVNAEFLKSPVVKAYMDKGDLAEYKEKVVKTEPKKDK